MLLWFWQDFQIHLIDTFVRFQLGKQRIVLWHYYIQRILAQVIENIGLSSNVDFIAVELIVHQVS